MNEIIEQYKNAKGWHKQMRLFMIALTALGAVFAVLGFVFKDFWVILLILGAVMASLGIFTYAFASHTLKKFDETLRRHFKEAGKTDEEISSILEEKND